MNPKQDTRLGTEKLGPLIVSMAVPAVAAQVINVLYNIVDRIYIGHIPEYGDLALTGVGITFPIITLISAFSAFAGRGGAPQASMALGRGDYEEAETILGTCVALLSIFAICLTVLITIFKKPILYLFGASDNTIQYAETYIGIYLLGTIFVLFAVGLNTFISGQGNAKVAMLSVCVGAGVNIVLDPILIFGFGLGVKGAALATLFSQACSAFWVIYFLCSKKSVIRLKKSNICMNKRVLVKITGLGISPMIIQSTESMVCVVLNAGLQKYGGDIYVGSMAILLSVMQLITTPLEGIAQGIQPIISYNYGALNKERVIGTYKRMLAICLSGTIVFGSITIIAPGFLVGLFTSDLKLYEVSTSIMPAFFIGICFIGIQMASQNTLLALGQAKISIAIALFRKVIFLMPLALILPRYMGVMGIYYAEPIADFMSILFSTILFVKTFKKVIIDKL